MKKLIIALILLSIPQILAYWLIGQHTKAENAPYESLIGYLVLFTALWISGLFGLIAWSFDRDKVNSL